MVNPNISSLMSQIINELRRTQEESRGSRIWKGRKPRRKAFPVGPQAQPAPMERSGAYITSDFVYLGKLSSVLP